MTESIILCKSESSKRGNETFWAPIQSSGFNYLSFWCVHLYKLATQGRGKAHSAEGKTNSLGAHAPPLRWWKAGGIGSLTSLQQGR